MKRRASKPKPIILPKVKRKKAVEGTEAYLLLEVTENQWLFAVQRAAVGQEQFVKSDPDGKLLGPVYTGVTYLVSPFINYETNRAGESCTCLSWRTRRKRCIHLKKFYEMNPELKSADIYEDTCLHPLTIADTICDELQKSYGPNLRDTMARNLEEIACEKFRTEAEFRQKLAACFNENPSDDSPEDARDWLKIQMTNWAKTSGEVPIQNPND